MEAEARRQALIPADRGRSRGQGRCRARCGPAAAAAPPRRLRPRSPPRRRRRNAGRQEAGRHDVRAKPTPAVSARSADAEAPSRQGPRRKPRETQARRYDPASAASHSADAGPTAALPCRSRRKAGMAAQVASADPTTPRAAAAEAPTNTARGESGFSVQLASSPSESDARATLSRLQRQFPCARWRLGPARRSRRQGHLLSRARRAAHPRRRRQDLHAAQGRRRGMHPDARLSPARELAAVATPSPGLSHGRSGARSSAAPAPALGADERAFFKEAQPWGLILFKRNVADQAQLHRLVGEFREIWAERRAGADRPGRRAGAAARAAALAELSAAASLRADQRSLVGAARPSGWARG